MIISVIRRFRLLFSFQSAPLWVLITFLLSPVQGQAGRDQEILGWVERVRLVEPEIYLDAKLDSGAETSSLDVEILKKFRKDNKRWVRFVMIDRETEDRHIMVLERVRTVSIVRHGGERQFRPVVIMQLCLAGRNLSTEVSLIDRSEFKYPLLLGRKTLESFALIDPGNQYLGSPDCKSPKQDGSTKL